MIKNICTRTTTNNNDFHIFNKEKKMSFFAEDEDESLMLNCDELFDACFCAGSSIGKSSWGDGSPCRCRFCVVQADKKECEIVRCLTRERVCDLDFELFMHDPYGSLRRNDSDVPHQYFLQKLLAARSTAKNVVLLLPSNEYLPLVYEPDDGPIVEESDSEDDENIGQMSYYMSGAGEAFAVKRSKRDKRFPTADSDKAVARRAYRMTTIQHGTYRALTSCSSYFGQLKALEIHVSSMDVVSLDLTLLPKTLETLIVTRRASIMSAPNNTYEWRRGVWTVDFNHFACLQHLELTDVRCEDHTVVLSTAWHSLLSFRFIGNGSR